MQAKDNNTTTARGREAEQQAAEQLERRGLRILARNYRVRGGEIDLICRDSQQLVFVEVRMRNRQDYGDAAASITYQKRQRIIFAARHFLLQHPEWGGHDCRFDCFLIAGDQAEWLRNAFSADD